MYYNLLKNLDGLRAKTNIVLIKRGPISNQKAGLFAHNVCLEYSKYVNPGIRNYGKIVTYLTDY